MLLIVSLCGLLLLPALPLPSAEAGQRAVAEQRFTATVAKVIDGDTIRLKDGRRLRYIGIDTPETRKKKRGRWMYDPQPFAVAATRANRKWVTGKQLTIVLGRDPVDRYGRLLGYVYVGEVFINQELVRAGLARARAYPPNTRLQTQLKRAQQQARAEGRGMWQRSQHYRNRP